MAKLKIKRAVSFVMATVLSLTAFMGVGANTAFAAAGEKTNVYVQNGYVKKLLLNQMLVIKAFRGKWLLIMSDILQLMDLLLLN